MVTAVTKVTTVTMVTTVNVVTTVTKVTTVTMVTMVPYFARKILITFIFSTIKSCMYDVFLTGVIELEELNYKI